MPDLGLPLSIKRWDPNPSSTIRKLRHALVHLIDSKAQRAEEHEGATDAGRCPHKPINFA